MNEVIQVTEVSAGRGLRWLVDAFDLFRRRPLAWIGLCSGWLVITFGLIIVPLVGGVIANFLQPVFFASCAIAAFRQLAGEPGTMGDLFAGFRRNARSLINLGAILLMAVLLVGAGHGLDAADVVIAMTDQQKADLMKLYPAASEKPVHTLREFAEESGDIEDPFEKGDEKFTEVREEIKRLIPTVADRILGADWALDE